MQWQGGQVALGDDKHPLDVGNDRVSGQFQQMVHRLWFLINGKQKLLHPPDLARNREGALHIGFGQ